MLIFIGCNPKKKDHPTTSYRALSSPVKSVPLKEQAQDLTSPEASAEDTLTDYSICDSLIQKRSYYWSKKDSIIQHILSINDGTLPKQHRSFLTALLDTSKSVLSFQKPLAGIFRLTGKGPGVLSDSQNVLNNAGQLFEYYPEQRLIRSKDTLNYSHYMDQSIYKVYKGVLDSAGIDQRDIHIYGIDFKSRSRVLEVARQYSECESYTFLPIDTTYLRLKDKVLFSSQYDLDLEYLSHPTIDSLQQTDPIHICWDCPNNAKQVTVFARLKGTKNVYFTYADTFPYNDKLHVPTRGLIYFSENNQIIELWSSSIDHFGCSCL